MKEEYELSTNTIRYFCQRGYAKWESGYNNQGAILDHAGVTSIEDYW